MGDCREVGGQWAEVVNSYRYLSIEFGQKWRSFVALWITLSLLARGITRYSVVGWMALLVLLLAQFMRYDLSTQRIDGIDNRAEKK
jgi:hypothetical protein